MNQRTTPVAEAIKLAVSSCVVALLLSAAVPALAAPAASPPAEPSASSGMFGSLAQRVWTDQPTFAGGLDPSKPLLTSSSPDGRSKLVATFHKRRGGEYIRLDLVGAIGARRFNIASGPNSEVAWASDSRSLFVTVNDGGYVGDYRLVVVTNLNGGLHTQDVSRLVRAAFGPLTCYDPEDANVVGVSWLSPSRLLVAAEVAPHSNCERMETFKAYVVDVVRAKIVASFDQLEAKRRFENLLGPRLMGAWDECVRTPRVCTMPERHSKTHPYRLVMK